MASFALSIFGTLSSQPYLKIPSIFTFIGILIIIAVRSFPERKLSAESLAQSQRPVTKSHLQQLDTPILKVGVIGEKQSGKSTFLQYALQRPYDPMKTTSIEIRIVPIPNAIPQTFCALVDGDGSQFSQQFEVCDHVDLLFLFLDHNPSEAQIEIADQRLRAHENFLSQLRSHLNRDDGESPRHIHFVLNKRDLWNNNPTSKNTLTPWFCNIVEEWRDYGMAYQITSSYHSNWNAKDVSIMLRRINDSVPI